MPAQHNVQCTTSQRVSTLVVRSGIPTSRTTADGRTAVPERAVCAAPTECACTLSAVRRLNLGEYICTKHARRGLTYLHTDRQAHRKMAHRIEGGHAARRHVSGAVGRSECALAPRRRPPSGRRYAARQHIGAPSFRSAGVHVRHAGAHLCPGEPAARCTCAQGRRTVCRETGR